MASYFTRALMDMDSQLEFLESLQALAKNAEITESIQGIAKKKETAEKTSANNLTSHISSSNAFDLKCSLGDYLNNVIQDSNDEKNFNNVIYTIGTSSPSPNSNSDKKLDFIPFNHAADRKRPIPKAKEDIPYSPLRLKSEISVGTDTNEIPKSAHSNNPKSISKEKKMWFPCFC